MRSAPWPIRSSIERDRVTAKHARSQFKFLLALSAPYGALGRIDSRETVCRLCGFDFLLLTTMDSSTEPKRPARLARAAPFLTAFLVALTYLTLPRQPFLVDDALSEKSVLSYAHEHGMQFGTDIIFTYGPLGFLTSRHYFPHAAGLRMVVDLLLTYSVSLGVCLIAWRLTLFWRCLLASVFVYFTANLDPRADLLIYAGLLCWGLLALAESAPWLGFYALGFILFAVFGLLVKANFLFVAGLSAVAIASDLLLRRRYRQAFIFIFALGAILILGWLLSGQRLSHLPLFVAHTIPIVRGYDQAVGLDGMETFKWRGLLVATLATVALIVRAFTAHISTYSVSFRVTRWRRGILFLWLGLFLFAVWKHGFVRADLYHMGFWFGFAPIIVLTLELFPCGSGSARFWTRVLGLACSLVALVTLESFFFSSFKLSTLQPFHAFRENVGALLQPNEYRREMSEKYEAARHAAELPKLREIIAHSSVDVFGHDQCYAVFNGLNYHPRPVFQSYMAYNSPLMDLNEQFYLSKAAPEYVLFGLSSIDRKFPPLEDARVLRHLLLNYQAIATEGLFLLLKSNSCSRPKLTFVREGTARMGERISVADSNETETWMEIDVQQTVFGRFRQLLYKSPKIRLAVWSGSVKKPLARMAAPAPMLAAGFLSSPLLLHTQDMLNYYGGKPTIRPDAYSIELDTGGKRFWRSTVRFRIYHVEKEMTPKSGGPRAMPFQDRIPSSDEA